MTAMDNMITLAPVDSK